MYRTVPRTIRFALALSAYLCAATAVLTAVAPAASAQNVNSRYDGIAQTPIYLEGQYILGPIPFATITVCNYPAQGVPCTNTATLYAGPTIIGGTGPNPVAADEFGNFGFWAGAGYYQYTITNNLNQSSGPYTVVLGGAGGSGGATFPSTQGLVWNLSSSTSETATSQQIVGAINTNPSLTLLPSTLPIATASALGGVSPDGATITINPTTGVISAPATGGIIPGTTNLLKGTGVTGVSTAAQPGTDYVIPSGNVATATSLAANPATCANNQVPSGVLASGAATGCQPITPITTPGDMIYGSSPSGTPTRLPGNTLAQAQVLVSQGNGASALAPSWSNAPAISAANMTNIPTPSSAATLTGCTLAGATAGSICYWNGTAWLFLPGNTGSTNYLSESSAGVPSWAAVSGGSSAWSSLTAPTAALSLSMGNTNTTAWTVGAATAAANMFTWQDTAANTGTGLLGHFTTKSGSAMTPWQADANGVGWQVSTTGTLASTGTSGISGSVALSGSTSGTLTVTVPTTGSSYTLQLPSSQPSGAATYMSCSASNPAVCSWVSPSATSVASEEQVSFSATPTFSTTYNESTITLTANITSFTLAAGQAGQGKTLTFCQNGTGGYTVTAPTNVHGFFTVGTTASKCSSQHYTYNGAQTAWLADSAGVVNM